MKTNYQLLTCVVASQDVGRQRVPHHDRLVRATPRQPTRRFKYLGVRFLVPPPRLLLPSHQDVIKQGCGCTRRYLGPLHHRVAVGDDDARVALGAQPRNHVGHTGDEVKVGETGGGETGLEGNGEGFVRDALLFEAVEP